MPNEAKPVEIITGRERRLHQRADLRDLMLACVEARFNAVRAPHPVQWLADNGSAFTARDTIDFAATLGLVLSPRSAAPKAMASVRPSSKPSSASTPASSLARMP
jgi:hypothetical protein